ncbi:hypothetical protein Droror1_Dr00018507 [Drosera rotundifolia]
MFSAIATDRVIASFGSRLLESGASTLLKILLVVFFGSVELLSRQDFSDNLRIQELLMLFQRFSRSLLLLGRDLYYVPTSFPCNPHATWTESHSYKSHLQEDASDHIFSTCRSKSPIKPAIL